MRCCPAALAPLHSVLVSDDTATTESDWSEEYLAPVISVKVVAGVDEAIASNQALARLVAQALR